MVEVNFNRVLEISGNAVRQVHFYIKIFMFIYRNEVTVVFLICIRKRSYQSAATKRSCSAHTDASAKLYRAL